MKTVKKRLSNFELLRIVAMFMIVLHHAILHGVWNNLNRQIAINNLNKFNDAD